MNQAAFRITVKKEADEYYAYSDDFPGVYGRGKTNEAAKSSILEAVCSYIQYCLKIPNPVKKEAT